MTAAGEGRGRIQPLNGLDELLSLPGRAGKRSGAPLSNADDMESSSFTQMFTEDLLLLTGAAGPLPLREANALPLVAEKAAVYRTVQLTTTGEGTLPKPLANKDVKVKGKGENPPAARGIVPNIVSFLHIAVPFFSAAVPVTSEGKDDKLPSSDEAEELALPPAVENTMNQAAPALGSLFAGPAKDAVTDKLRTTEVPAAASRAGAEISSTLLQPSTQKVDNPGHGAQTSRVAAMASSLPPAVENTMNQAASASGALLARTEKAAVAHQEIAETLGEKDAEKDVHLSINTREPLVKAGLEEFAASKGDVKQGTAMDDKGRPHAKEQLNVPGIMNTNVNAVLSPLSKEQSMAASAGAILEQVAAQLPQAINKGAGRIRISLAPDNLGKLDMDLVVRESRVQIILTAESRTVQQTLQGHVEQLKEALQQQGLEVDGFNVLLQNGRQGRDDTAGGGNPFWNEYSRAAVDKKGTRDDNFLLAAGPFVPGRNAKKGAEGINIFV